MSGRVGGSTAGAGDIKASYSAKQKIKQAVSKLKYTLPTKKGEFTPDMKQVGLGYLQGDEYSKFLTEDKANFSTYGMDELEREASTLRFDAAKGGLVDSSGELADVSHRVYNVTSNGRLIYQPQGIVGAFNHSSITRDGAVICAGYITVESGKIKSIDTSSGHYQPTSLDLYNAIELLASKGEVFAPDCIASSHGGTPMSPGEFLRYMNEDVMYEGRRMPRVASMRQERIAEHELISGGKVIRFEGANIVDTVLSADIAANIEGKGKYLCNFPTTAFSESYIRGYAFRTFGEEGHEREIRSVSLSPNELLANISTIPDPRALEASVKIIENFAPVDPALNLYALDARFKVDLSAILLSPEKLPNTLRNFNAQQINTLLSSVPEGMQRSFVVSSFLDGSSAKELQILSDVQANLDDNSRRLISTTLLSGGRFEDTYAKLDPFRIWNLTLVLPDDRKRQVIDRFLVRGDPKSLEILTNNFGAFDKETREYISTTLLSVGRFEDSYAKLDPYRISGLVQALPDDRKRQVIDRFLVRGDPKSLEILTNNFAVFDKTTQEHISTTLLSIGSFEDTYAKLDPFRIWNLTLVLPDDRKRPVIDSFLVRGDAKSLEILTYNVTSFDKETREYISTTLLSGGRFEDSYARLEPYRISGLVQEIPTEHQKPVICELLARGDAKAKETINHYISNSYRISPLIASELIAPESLKTLSLDSVSAASLFRKMDDTNKIRFIQNLINDDDSVASNRALNSLSYISLPKGALDPFLSDENFAKTQRVASSGALAEFILYASDRVKIQSIEKLIAGENNDKSLETIFKVRARGVAGAHANTLISRRLFTPENFEKTIMLFEERDLGIIQYNSGRDAQDQFLGNLVAKSLVPSSNPEINRRIKYISDNLKDESKAAFELKMRAASAQYRDGVAAPAPISSGPTTASIRTGLEAAASRAPSSAGMTGPAPGNGKAGMGISGK